MNTTSPGSRPAAILFDKDGTLLDYRATWVPINREVALFAAGGEPVLARELLALGGHDPATDDITAGTPLAAGSVEQIAELFAGRLGARTPPRLAREIDRIFREGGARHSVLLKGVAEAIATLAARGFVLGIATNDSIGGLEASMARHDVLGRFVFLAGCDSGHGAKPEPGMALAFAAAIGVAPREIAVVGDSTHDLEMARRAGAGHRVGVLCGTAGRADLAPHATLILADVPAMLADRCFARPGPA